MPDLSRTVIWLLPLMVMAGVYLLTRVKFWYLGEGDLVIDFSEWAAQNRRPELKEKDENFYFHVAREDY